jgi:dTDP-4-dehydrorhamnose 3,5-epimerase-like enzyme
MNLYAIKGISDDELGFLSFLEQDSPISFDIKRVFYLHRLKKGVIRGRHAHRTCHQFFVCLQGAVAVSTKASLSGKGVVVLQDAELTTPGSVQDGLYVPPMYWVEIEVLFDNTILLCLCSEKYSESEYIRDWDEFVRLTQ